MIVGNIYHYKNPITTLRVATPGWELEDNYRNYAEVQVEQVADSNVFTALLKMDLHPEANGETRFYLNEAFRATMNPQPPTVGSNTIARLTDRSRLFKIGAWFLTGTANEPEDLAVSSQYLVVWGGISKEKFPGLNFFTTYLPTTKKFLTWAPLTKTVDRLQEDYLTYFVFGNLSQVKLQVKAYYTDQTTATQVVKTLATEQNHIVQIPAGPQNSGALLITPAKTLRKYELTLLDQANTVVSETRTYIVATQKHPRTRYFMFLNSLGGYEVLRFTAIAQRKAEYDRTLVQRFLPYNYQALDGEFETNQITMMQKDSYGSGYIRETQAKAWHDYLKDFLLSTKVFDVTDGTRKPLIITAGTHADEDQDNLRFIRFEARLAYDNTSYTPAVI